MADVKHLKIKGNSNYVLGASQRLSDNFITIANNAYAKGQVMPIAGDSIETAICRLLAGYEQIIYKIKSRNY